MKSVRGALWNALQALGLGCLLAPAAADVRAASGDVVWSYSAPSNTVVMGPGFGADGTAYSLGMAGPGELSVSAISTNGVVGWSRVLSPAGPGVWSSIPPSAILAPGGDILACWQATVARVSAMGELRWSRSFVQPVAGVPVVGPDGSAFVPLAAAPYSSSVSLPPNLACLSLEGNLDWTTELDVGSLKLDTDGRILCFGQGGVRLWPDGSPDVAFPSLGASTVAFWGEETYLYEQQADLNYGGRFVLPLDAGGLSHGLMDAGGWGLSARGVELPDHTLCIPGLNGFLYGINPDGTAAWNLQPSSAVCTGVTVTSNGILYAAFANGDVASLDAGHRMRWVRPTGRSQLSGSPLLLDGGRVLLCPGNDGAAFVEADGIPMRDGGFAATRGLNSGNDSRHLPLPAPVTPPPSLQASGNSTGSFISVTWSNVPAARYYEVWSGPTSDLSQARRAAGPVGGLLRYADIEPLPLVTNYYWVRAGNAAGVGPFSGPVAGSRRAGLDGTFAWRRSALGGMPLAATVSDTGAVALVESDGTVQWVDSTGRSIGGVFRLPTDAAGAAVLFQCQTADGHLLLGTEESHRVNGQHGGGRLLCLDQQGAVVWQRVFQNSLTYAPALGPTGNIYLPLRLTVPSSPAPEAEGLMALSPAGDTLWVFSVTGGVVTSPAVWDDGTVFVATPDSNFYRLSPEGGVLRRIPLGEVVHGRPVPASSGHWWVAGANGYRVVPPDFSGSRLLTGPDFAGVTDEAVTAGDGQVVFGAGGVSAYRAPPTGLSSSLLAGGDGVAAALTRSNTCLLATPTGIKEVTLTAATRRILGSPAQRITPVVVDPNGLAIFGGVDGTWYAAQLTAPPAATAWPQPGHDARRSGLATTPPGFPGVVTGLTAKSNTYRAAVVLKWISATNAESYSVYRRGPGDPVEGIPMVTNLWGATTFVDTSLVSGRSYDYWVVAVNHSGAGPPGAVVTWKAPVTRPGDLLLASTVAESIVGSPAIGADGTVYAGLLVTNVQAVGAGGWGLAAFRPDLSVRWFVPAALAPGFGPSVTSSGNTLILEKAGVVVSVGADGCTSWKLTAGGEWTAPPAVDADGRVFLARVPLAPRTYDAGRLLALDATGHVLWERTLPSGRLVTRVLLAGEGRLLAWDEAGWLGTFSVAGGDLISSGIPGINQADLLAITAGGESVIASYSEVRLLRPDLTLAWKVPLQSQPPVRSAVVAPDGAIYAPDLFGGVTRIAGGLTVRVSQFTTALGSLLLDADGVLYAASRDGVMRAFGTNGTQRWATPLTGDLTGCRPVPGPGGVVYAANSQGWIYALYANATVPDSGWPCDGADPARTSRGRAVAAVPGTPVLSASYAETADGVHLRWPAVPGAWHYEVMRADSPDPLQAVVLAQDLAAVEFNDTRAVADAEYWYWIVAWSGAGFTVSDAAVGLRRSPAPGDLIASIELGPMPHSMALTPGGELRVLGTNRLWAFDRTLKVLWQAGLSEPGLGPLVIGPAGELCFRSVDAAGQTNRLRVFSATGAPAWSWNSSSAWISAPACGAGGTLHVAQDDGGLTTFDLAGRTLWHVDCGEPLRFPPSLSAPGSVVACSSRGTVWSFTPTGVMLWRAALLAMDAPAFTTEGHILIRTGDDSSLAWVLLDSSTGRELWHTDRLPTADQTASALVGPGNRLWLDWAPPGMVSSRLLVTQHLTSAGLLSPDVTEARSAGLGIALTEDGRELSSVASLDAWGTLQVADSTGRAALTSPFSVFGAFDASLLDDDGRIVVLPRGKPAWLSALFLGSPAADTAWPAWRGNLQRTGQASRQVRPVVGSAVFRDGRRMTPLNADVRLAQGRPASIRLSVDGVPLPAESPDGVGGYWPAEAAGIHELTIEVERTNGTRTVDGPWRFGLPTSPIRVVAVGASGLEFQTESLFDSVYQLEASDDLKLWSPVGPSRAGTGLPLRWNLALDVIQVPHRFFRIVTMP